jgi:hypothetical protein
MENQNSTMEVFITTKHQLHDLEKCSICQTWFVKGHQCKQKLLTNEKLRIECDQKDSE